MNTPTHILIAAALLTRRLPSPVEEKREVYKQNALVVFGALLPDLSMFIFFFWAQFLTSATSNEIWNTLYWQEPWQTLSAISNSIPLMIVVCTLGWRLQSRALMLVALAMLSHALFDLPFHAEDAHQHFWPLTDWRFHSPLSYWDVDHHAAWVSVMEWGLLLTCTIILWRRFASKWVRALSLLPLFIHSTAFVYITVFTN